MVLLVMVGIFFFFVVVILVCLECDYCGGNSDDVCY